MMGIDGLSLVASEREPIEWELAGKGPRATPYLASTDGRWSIAKVPETLGGHRYELLEQMHWAPLTGGLGECSWHLRHIAASSDDCKRRAEELADG